MDNDYKVKGSDWALNEATIRQLRRIPQIEKFGTLRPFILAEPDRDIPETQLVLIVASILEEKPNVRERPSDTRDLDALNFIGDKFTPTDRTHTVLHYSCNDVLSFLAGARGVSEENLLLTDKA